jgi:membrane protease subunit (stomatin/prohibitin family)
MSILKGLFGQKPADDQPQEFRDVTWGTVQPVTLRLGEGIVSLAAHGTYSFAVSDRQRLPERIGDVQDQDKQRELFMWLRPILTSKLFDALGGMAPTKSSVSELAAATDEIAAAVKAQAGPDFQAVGLTLTDFRIANLVQR